MCIFFAILQCPYHTSTAHSTKLDFLDTTKWMMLLKATSSTPEFTSVAWTQVSVPDVKRLEPHLRTLRTCGHGPQEDTPKFSQSFLFKNPIHRFNSRKPSDFSANRRICRALDSQYSDAINNSGFTPREETFTWICRAFKSSQRNLESWPVWEAKVVLRMLFEQQDWWRLL